MGGRKFKGMPCPYFISTRMEIIESYKVGVWLADSWRKPELLLDYSSIAKMKFSKNHAFLCEKPTSQVLKEAGIRQIG